MLPSDITPESVLPHRERMLLVDDILHVDDRSAVTRSTVTAKWPLFDGKEVQSLVLIELVAQTAGILNGWIRDQRHGAGADKKGWIVGVRQARLPLVAGIPGTELITTAENRMAFEGFREIYGTVGIRKKTIAEITLQLLRA